MDKLTTKEGLKYIRVDNLMQEYILWFHPAFADHHIFIKQVESIKEYNHILIDLPGHGENQKASFYMYDVPNIVLSILDEHGIDKVHLVGVSLGSLVVQAITHATPDKVLTQTIVGGYSIHKHNENILKSQSKEMLKWLGLILFSMKRFRNHVINSSVSTEFGKQIFREGTEKFKRSSFKSMNGMNKFFTPKEVPFNHPTLLMVGEYDLELAKDVALVLSGEVNTTYKLIKNAGHCANIDNHIDFNKELLLFLENHID
jgi:pimeloyl-ACP methyl ester carboxylesterase